MRKGLTTKIEEIIDDISGLNGIGGYVLCGGTALAMQLGHRQSEDLDWLGENQRMKNLRLIGLTFIVKLKKKSDTLTIWTFLASIRSYFL